MKALAVASGIVFWTLMLGVAWLRVRLTQLPSGIVGETS